ncbi:FadR/GntR family transcriptional regulator [Streptomyces rishiriensis]|uniref:FadR/GntR family transcriptional regulator n=1 Tax=Streptomyces rishiriensis TaxID=68264 RepID=UPI0037D89FA7
MNNTPAIGAALPAHVPPPVPAAVNGPDEERRDYRPGYEIVAERILEQFEFRRVQEMAAGSLAATRATPAELRTIEVAMQNCRHGFAQGQVDVFNQGDEDFHVGVAVASHNTFLVSTVRDARRLQRQSSAIGIHDVLSEGTAAAVEEHEAIYRAIRDGRPEEAAKATADHLDRTLEDYRREIQRRLFRPTGSQRAR